MAATCRQENMHANTWLMQAWTLDGHPFVDLTPHTRFDFSNGSTIQNRLTLLRSTVQNMSTILMSIIQNRSTLLRSIMLRSTVQIRSTRHRSTILPLDFPSRAFMDEAQNLQMESLHLEVLAQTWWDTQLDNHEIVVEISASI